MAPADDKYPRLFGRYLLFSALARGGMGELHLAVTAESKARKVYVIKQLLAGFKDEPFISRFGAEVRLAVRLTHGNIVPVFEGGHYEDRYFLVMEFIEGKDLRTVWETLAAQNRRMPLATALYIVKEVCRALDYVHGFGSLDLVHRDINPPNVLLSYAGEVKLTDFGLAKGRMNTLMTSPNVLFGKISHMSPEQARKVPVDARADIYAVGVMLWELVTGKSLLPAEGTYQERLARARHPEIGAPSEHVPELPAEIDRITLRALAADPDQRYANAEELRGDLAQLLATIDPRADAPTVRDLLNELYGAHIEDERREREVAIEHALHRLADGRVPTRAQPVPPMHLDEETASAEHGPSTTAQSDAPTPRLRPGSLLDERYRIEELIGEGGMGTVYRATHLDLDKRVAVKVLHSLYRWMPDAVQRFRREARAASRIGHPHIIEIYDAGTTTDGSIYFTMECLDGQDLADLLDAEMPLAIDRSVAIAAQIADAVGAAHEAGIIHRDLKPENIFLTARDNNIDFVKVLDFGIAQINRTEGMYQDRVTNPGVAMGTPQYMSPEQARGQPCDHRTDIYAVGALLYEMVSGVAPHPGDDALDVLSRKSTEPPLPLRERCPEVSRELERIVHWALEIDAADRPQSMSHWLYELKKLQSGRAEALATMLGLGGSARAATTAADGPLTRVSTGPPERPAQRGSDRTTLAMSPSLGTRRSRRGMIAGLLVGAGVAAALIAARFLSGPAAHDMTPKQPRASTTAGSTDRSIVRSSGGSQTSDDGGVIR